MWVPAIVANTIVEHGAPVIQTIKIFGPSPTMRETSRVVLPQTTPAPIPACDYTEDHAQAMNFQPTGCKTREIKDLDNVDVNPQPNQKSNAAAPESTWHKRGIRIVPIGMLLACK